MSVMHPVRALLVFARDPLVGAVKTRLIPAIGAGRATLVYRHLLAVALRCAAASTAGQRCLWVDRPPGRWLARRAALAGLDIRQQDGDDLGERMCRALTRTLSTADRAVLIGSDCADYSAGYIDAAFAALDEHDAVIGPAADGGYALIGMRRADRRVFADIPWGGADVLDATRERLRTIGWQWHELPVVRDVDRVTDLQGFPRLARLAGVGHTAAPGNVRMPPHQDDRC